MRCNSSVLHKAFAFLLGTFLFLPHSQADFTNNEQQQQPLLKPLGRDCLLDCENGGLCEFVSDSLEELQHIAQSGHLIQRCRCPIGWGGVTCEIPTETCDLRTKTCELSGRPCDKIGSQWTCHCHVADRVDYNFASVVCRRGFTEYCNPHPYTPHDALYFCTNGGKCVTDFLSAREGPSDINVRRKYMDAGCRCNENFEGERCEKLVFEAEHLAGLIEPERIQNQGYGVSEFEPEQVSDPSQPQPQPNSDSPETPLETPNAGGNGDMKKDKEKKTKLIRDPIVIIVFVASLVMFLGGFAYGWKVREERRSRILGNASRQEMDYNNNMSPYGNMAKNYSTRSSIVFGSRARSSRTSRRSRNKPRISKRLDQIPEENLTDIELEKHTPPPSPSPVYSNPMGEMYM